MAVATDNQQLRAGLAVTQYDHDPNGTNAVDVAWVDMRDFSSILASFFRTVGTSALTYKLIGNAESDGSGTDVEIKTGSAVPDAVGDYAFLEATEEEIMQAGVDAGVDVRYVALNLTFATGTDEGVVTYIRKGKRKYKDLSSDSIA